jgi:hypothetical protein
MAPHPLMELLRLGRTAITTAAVRRLDANPWRMTAADCTAALAHGDTEPLRGTPAASPWDPALATTLSNTGQSVMEASSRYCST